jgi:hypothetical protein
LFVQLFDLRRRLASDHESGDHLLVGGEMRIGGGQLGVGLVLVVLVSGIVESSGSLGYSRGLLLVKGQILVRHVEVLDLTGDGGQLAVLGGVHAGLGLNRVELLPPHGRLLDGLDSLYLLRRLGQRLDVTVLGL